MALENCIVTREVFGPFNADSTIHGTGYDGFFISHQDAGFAQSIPGVGTLYTNQFLGNEFNALYGTTHIPNAFKITITPFDAASFDPDLEDFPTETGGRTLCIDDLTISGYKGWSRKKWRNPYLDTPNGVAYWTRVGSCHEDNPLISTRFDPNRYRASGLNGTESWYHNGQNWQGLGPVHMAADISSVLYDEYGWTETFGFSGNSTMRNAWERLQATFTGTCPYPASSNLTEGITAVERYKIFHKWGTLKRGDQATSGPPYYGDIIGGSGQIYGSYTGTDQFGNPTEQVTLPGSFPGNIDVTGSWVDPGVDAASKWDDRVSHVVMFNNSPINAVREHPDFVSYTDWEFNGGPPPYIGQPGNGVTVIVVLDNNTLNDIAGDPYFTIGTLNDINIDIDGDSVAS
tara:strand:+ start:112 stop:1317 length:1206 start_codon:yes stop_codon:yes gene_type:complete